MVMATIYEIWWQHKDVLIWYTESYGCEEQVWSRSELKHKRDSEDSLNVPHKISWFGPKGSYGDEQ